MEIISNPLNVTSTPKSNARKPHVVILLDASGSMNSHRNTVVSTFNEYKTSILKTAKTLSLYTFESDNLEERIFQESPGRVKDLTTDDYRIGGWTPLYDAMGLVIQKFRFEDRPVQFITHTDGDENASKGYTKHALDELIAQMTKQGWLFTYLGEGLQAQAQFSTFQGLKVNFEPGQRGVMMRSLSNTTALYSSSNNAVASAYTTSGSDTINIGESVEDFLSKASDEEDSTNTC